MPGAILVAYLFRGFGCGFCAGGRVEDRGEDYKLALSVDTWARRIAHKLGRISGNDNEIKIYLIKECEEFGIDPCKFASGIWFLGFHSLDILLKNCLGETII
jgi:hypothetical protein